jgi:hypothetical protein
MTEDFLINNGFKKIVHLYFSPIGDVFEIGEPYFFRLHRTDRGFRSWKYGMEADVNSIDELKKQFKKETGFDFGTVK